MENFHHPFSSSPLSIWLDYLGRIHTKAIDLGLERIQQVAERLDLLNPKHFVFTVAGTNGKGTTCRALEVFLMASGYRVGVYSSPDLLHYNERVRIQGVVPSDSSYTKVFSLIETARSDISLSFFESTTLAALMLFKQAGLDIVILEVGLGGRLDATNIIDANMAIITSIALDHTDFLGADRESIAREKAGIFRQNQHAIIGEPDMPNSMAEIAVALGTTLSRVGYDWYWRKQDKGWEFQDDRGVLSALSFPQIPLPNAATAIAALRASHFQVDDQCIRENISSLSLPGRFQRIPLTLPVSVEVILDVAHNPHAADYLSVKLAELPKMGRLIAIVGMLQDKDIAATLAPMLPLVDQWHCASLDVRRGAPAEALAAHLPKMQTTVHTSVKEAWQAASQQAKENDTILVFGSFSTVSKALEAINHEEKAQR